MFFLIGLVIFSTITMVNLLMSAIIDDYAEMKKEVEIENLYFIAEYVIEEGWYTSNLMCTNPSPLTRELLFCPRLICINCELDPLPIPRPFSSCSPAMEAREREPLLRKLLDIRKGKSRLCKYHSGEPSSEEMFGAQERCIKTTRWNNCR